jgi:hypothetical protein
VHKFYIKCQRDAKGTNFVEWPYIQTTHAITLSLYLNVSEFLSLCEIPCSIIDLINNCKKNIVALLSATGSNLALDADLGSANLDGNDYRRNCKTALRSVSRLPIHLSGSFFGGWFRNGCVLLWDCYIICCPMWHNLIKLCLTLLCPQTSTGCAQSIFSLPWVTTHPHTNSHTHNLGHEVTWVAGGGHVCYSQRHIAPNIFSPENIFQDFKYLC